MQKLLPKLHGSRRKLLKTLDVLAIICLSPKKDGHQQDHIFDESGNHNLSQADIKFQLSFDKIARMYKNAIENGFASYAEA